MPHVPSAPSASALKRAPPCRGFEDLRTATDLLAMADEYETMDTLDEIKELTATLLSFRQCLRGMCLSWKTAISELDQAIKG